MTSYCGMTVTHIKGCPCETKVLFFFYCESSWWGGHINNEAVHGECRILKSFEVQSDVGISSQALTPSLSNLKAFLTGYLPSNGSFCWRGISLLAPLCDIKARRFFLRKLLPFRRPVLMDQPPSLQSDFSPSVKWTRRSDKLN